VAEGTPAAARSALSEGLAWRLDSAGKALSPDTIKKRGLKVEHAPWSCLVFQNLGQHHRCLGAF
jgi:hypothetical protein